MTNKYRDIIINLTSLIKDLESNRGQNTFNVVPQLLLLSRKYKIKAYDSYFQRFTGGNGMYNLSKEELAKVYELIYEIIVKIKARAANKKALKVNPIDKLNDDKKLEVIYNKRSIDFTNFYIDINIFGCHFYTSKFYTSDIPPGSGSGPDPGPSPPGSDPSPPGSGSGSGSGLHTIRTIQFYTFKQIAVFKIKIPLIISDNRVIQYPGTSEKYPKLCFYCQLVNGGYNLYYDDKIYESDISRHNGITAAAAPPVHDHPPGASGTDPAVDTDPVVATVSAAATTAHIGAATSTDGTRATRATRAAAAPTSNADLKPLGNTVTKKYYKINYTK